MGNKTLACRTGSEDKEMNTAPNTSRTRLCSTQDELSFDRNPNLNFIFGVKACVPQTARGCSSDGQDESSSNSPYAVPIISINLQAASKQNVKKYYTAKAEGQDEDECENLADIKKQLNAKALELGAFKESIDSKKEESVVKHEKTRKSKANTKSLDATDKTAKEGRADDSKSNITVLERALKRLYENRGYLTSFKDLTASLCELSRNSRMDDSDKLQKYKTFVHKLQEVAHQVSLDLIEKDINYFKSVISRGYPDSVTSICTAFETPVSAQEKQNSTKYHNQLTKIKAENAILQVQMGKLESTFAAITGKKSLSCSEERASEGCCPKIVEDRFTNVFKTFDGTLVRPQRHKSILYALTALSKQKTEVQNQHHVQLENRLLTAKDELDTLRRGEERQKRVGLQREQRYNELWTRYQLRTNELAEIQRVLAQKSRKVIELDAKNQSLAAKEAELAKAKEQIKQLLVNKLTKGGKDSKENAKFADPDVEHNASKERRKPGSIDQINELLRATIVPLTGALKQVYCDINTYRKALSTSIARNEAAESLFMYLLKVSLLSLNHVERTRQDKKS